MIVQQCQNWGTLDLRPDTAAVMTAHHPAAGCCSAAAMHWLPPACLIGGRTWQVPPVSPLCVIQESVVVPHCLQSCLSQNFIHCLELDESLDQPFWGYWQFRDLPVWLFGFSEFNNLALTYCRTFVICPGGPLIWYKSFVILNIDGWTDILL